MPGALPLPGKCWDWTRKLTVPGFLLSPFSSVSKGDLERQVSSVSTYRSRVWIPGSQDMMGGQSFPQGIQTHSSLLEEVTEAAWWQWWGRGSVIRWTGLRKAWGVNLRLPYMHTGICSPTHTSPPQPYSTRVHTGVHISHLQTQTPIKWNVIFRHYIKL